MKHLRSQVETDTPLRVPAREGLTPEEWRFFYARDDLHIRMRFRLPGRSATVGSPSSDWVLVEAGFRGGPQPNQRRPILSLIGAFVSTQPDAVRDALAKYQGDLEPFEMDLLKPERTFAEKLLALHLEMSKGVEGARTVRTRHYYDVVQLCDKSPDVRASIESRQLLVLLREAAIVSNTHFGAQIDIARLDLRTSPALNPSSKQIGVLAARYDDPNERALYWRERPSWEVILGRLAALRDALPPGPGS